MMTWHRLFGVCGIGITLAVAGCESEDGGGSNSVEPSPVVPCEAESKAECDRVAERIGQLKSERDAAMERNDATRLAHISLQLNQQTELLALLQGDQATPEAQASLQAKYDGLVRMLEADLALRRTPGTGTEPEAAANPVTPVTPGTPGTPTTPGTPDTPATPPIPATPDLPAYVYQPSEAEAVAHVTADYGTLYIAETATAEELKVDRPWAGYWYPLRRGDLYLGEAAPLRKLDLVTAGNATNLERDRVDVEHADTWEGLCNAWAMASILSKEPAATKKVQNVDFTVLDQKALLTKIHEKIDVKYYGIRYQGNADTDGTIQDLRPEAFHQLVMKQLGERRQAFVVDDDPGVEVWSKPMYRMRWTVKTDPDNANAFLVRAFPWMVRHRETLSPTATSDADRAAPQYDYRLFVDKSDVKDGKFKVIAGEWIGRSRDSHPDAAVVPVAGAAVGSMNASVQEHMDIVRQIVGL